MRMHLLKQIGYFLILLTLCRCGTATHRDAEAIDLHPFYGSPHDTLQDVTYTYVYEVLTETSEGTAESLEYWAIRLLDTHRYAFGRYDQAMNLLDTAVFRVDEVGTHVEHRHFVAEDNQWYPIDIRPRLILPWKLKPGQSYQNTWKYRYIDYGMMAEIYLVGTSTFVGITQVPNAFTEATDCAKMLVEDEIQAWYPEIEEEDEYTRETEIWYLKDVGFYRSIETYSYGASITTQLVERRGPD